MHHLVAVRKILRQSHGVQKSIHLLRICVLQQLPLEKKLIHALCGILLRQFLRKVADALARNDALSRRVRIVRNHLRIRHPF